MTHLPEDFAQRIFWNGRSVWLRRLRSEDKERYATFHASFDRARSDRWARLALPHPDRIAQTDPTDGDDIMLAALVDDDDGETILGVARALKSAREQTADFAIILRADVEGQGLGRLLMGKLINQCRDCGFHELVAYASADNPRLIALGRAFRFVQQASGMPGIVSLRLQLPASSQEE